MWSCWVDQAKNKQFCFVLFMRQQRTQQQLGVCDDGCAMGDVRSDNTGVAKIRVVDCIGCCVCTSQTIFVCRDDGQWHDLRSVVCARERESERKVCVLQSTPTGIRLCVHCLPGETGRIHRAVECGWSPVARWTKVESEQWWDIRGRSPHRSTANGAKGLR